MHTGAHHSSYAGMMHTCSASSTLHACNIRTRETKLGMHAKTEIRNWKVKDSITNSQVGIALPCPVRTQNLVTQLFSKLSYIIFGVTRNMTSF